MATRSGQGTSQSVGIRVVAGRRRRLPGRAGRRVLGVPRRVRQEPGARVLPSGSASASSEVPAGRSASRPFRQGRARRRGCRAGRAGQPPPPRVSAWLRRVEPRWCHQLDWVGPARRERMLRGRTAATHWLAGPLVERHGVVVSPDRVVAYVTCAGLARVQEAAFIVVGAVAGPDLVTDIGRHLAETRDPGPPVVTPTRHRPPAPGNPRRRRSSRSSSRTHIDTPSVTPFAAVTLPRMLTSQSTRSRLQGISRSLRSWKAEGRMVLAVVSWPVCGRACECSVCGFVGRFRYFGDPPRPSAKCPRCGSLERHRLFALWWTLERGRSSTKRVSALRAGVEYPPTSPSGSRRIRER